MKLTYKDKVQIWAENKSETSISSIRDRHSNLGMISDWWILHRVRQGEESLLFSKLKRIIDEFTAKVVLNKEVSLGMLSQAKERFKWLAQYKKNIVEKTEEAPKIRDANSLKEALTELRTEIFKQKWIPEDLENAVLKKLRELRLKGGEKSKKGKTEIVQGLM